MAARINPHSFLLPRDLSEVVDAALKDWAANGKVNQLWDRDASLWTGADESEWLGWLNIVDQQRAQVDRFRIFAEEIKAAGFAHILLLGMGGSSLFPEVISRSFGRIEGFPELHVLDSTDPAQVKSFENKIDFANTLFIVSSKSGTTLEPNIFKQHFFERTRQVVGDEEAGARFVAITDPDSKLQQAAEADRFRRIFFGLKSIGGRYSALSDFGLMPAAAGGIDVRQVLERAALMVEACGPEVSAAENPGVVLGAILGAAHNTGRDKLTVIASPGIYDLGAWMEQLIAESTGKNGNGVIPVDREQVAEPDVYANDRIFVYLRLETADDASQDAAVEAIEKAGYPVVRISLADVYDLGQEIFRWEVATAVAGSIIGINPFDQPDVEASKIATRNLTDAYERTGSLPAETPIFSGDGIKLFADGRNSIALEEVLTEQSLTSYLKAHLGRIKEHDYFALLAYIEMNEGHDQSLQAVRQAVRNQKRVATCLGFGPRFLHSTGQAYKGGPDSGVFLQITCDDATDLAVPGQKYTFGIVKAAQARGDLEVLEERGRRALRVHLGEDVDAGLATLAAAIGDALG